MQLVADIAGEYRVRHPDTASLETGVQVNQRLVDRHRRELPDLDRPLCTQLAIIRGQRVQPAAAG